METIKMKNGHLVINGQRWFDKINGNTYHSVQVFINGKLIAEQGLTYGYGDHYRQTSFELLKKIYPQQDKEAQCQYTERLFDSVLYFCHDVSRKKDL
jgi:hypothetical protein